MLQLAENNGVHKFLKITVFQNVFWYILCESLDQNVVQSSLVLGYLWASFSQEIKF